MKLAALYQNKCVLQRDKPILIWGEACPGEKIELNLGSFVTDTLTRSDGSWEASFPAMAAGGPYTLSVRGTDNSIDCRDVLIGEVWFCSGQSNMEMSVGASKDVEASLEGCAPSHLRVFMVPRQPKMDPANEVKGTWIPCTRKSLSRFSAVAYFFGKRIEEELEVPVGLISSSVGGSPCEAWTSEEALLDDPQLAHYVDKKKTALTTFAEDFKPYYNWQLKTELRSDPGNVGESMGWHAPDYPDEEWAEISLPKSWQEAGHPVSGSFWFRKMITIPEEWSDHPLLLSIGTCDKEDISYFNGTEIGRLSQAEDPNSWSIPRRYEIPAHLVRKGSNTIAVRVFSQIHDGGMRGPAGLMSIAPVDAPENAIPLAGNWRYKQEHSVGPNVPKLPAPPRPFGPGNPNTPTSLYNGMVHPFIGYSLRGVIWYQGESNVDRADEYKTLFPSMIRDWRKRWKDDFPFYFVQLANYQPDPKVESQKWPFLREAQETALKLPKTGMATAIDIGDPEDIHPTKKQDVGQRLARIALHHTYGKKEVVAHGPIFQRLEMREGKLILQFETGKCPMAQQGEMVAGFEYKSTPHGLFEPVKGKIEGNNVVLDIQSPAKSASIRFGFTDSPDISLYNEAGLPAYPFRTTMENVEPTSK